MTIKLNATIRKNIMAAVAVAAHDKAFNREQIGAALADYIRDTYHLTYAPKVGEALQVLMKAGLYDSCAAFQPDSTCHGLDRNGRFDYCRQWGMLISSLVGSDDNWGRKHDPRFMVYPITYTDGTLIPSYLFRHSAIFTNDDTRPAYNRAIASFLERFESLTAGLVEATSLLMQIKGVVANAKSVEALKKDLPQLEEVIDKVVSEWTKTLPVVSDKTAVANFLETIKPIEVSA